MKTKVSWRRFKDGDNVWRSFTEKIFVQDTSHKCPTYVHKTPPCQGSCPSGEDIRGWLAIVRQQEKPPVGVDWQEYAFRRLTDANPFPAMMGRVCPAPCQDGCNRNELEDFVGVLGGGDLGVDLAEDTLLVDDVGVAVREALGVECAVGLGDALVTVGEEWEVELLLLGELVL